MQPWFRFLGRIALRSTGAGSTTCPIPIQGFKVYQNTTIAQEVWELEPGPPEDEGYETQYKRPR